MHFLLLKPPGFVVTYFTDIPCAQAPTLTGRDGAGGLSSCAALGGEDFNFRVERGEVRQTDDSISCVDADTADIERRLIEVVHEMIIFALAAKCEKNSRV